MNLPRITVAEMLARADAEIHPRLHDLLGKLNEGGGLVCYENVQLDSSQAGQRTFLVFGAPYSMGTAEEVVAKHRWLHDLPSQRQHPTAYCLKGDVS